MSPDSISKFVGVVFGILGIACGFQAQASDVSGPITVDTTWRLADSPINVVGSVQIRNGASLIIESGVEVRFLAETALLVEQGAVRAVGESASPIVLGSGEPSPAKGDWGPIEFQNGSIDGATILDRVVIRHGKGISITQASPTLNRVVLENNLGAAITLDLGSSPVGEGLSAQGNDLNGVLVPSGTITGSARWALLGIPYVVEQGIVTVGLPPLTLTPASMSLRAGYQGTFTLNLAKPAPTGGLIIDVASNQPGVASTPVSLNLPAGTLHANFNVDALSPGSAQITVNRAGLGTATATLDVTPPITISFSTSNSIIPIGESRTLSITLGEPAPVGGLVVLVSSTNASAVTAPDQVFFAAGSSVRDLLVTAIAVGTSTLTASAQGYGNATSMVEVRSAFLSFDPIDLLATGSSRAVTVRLSPPAPQGGLSVAVSSSTPSVARISPSSINVAAGGSSATFTLTGVAPGTSELTATANGFSPTTSIVTITSRLAFDPAGPVTIPQATSDHFLVRLSHSAPAGGLTVSLQTPPGGALVVTPSTLEIPEGQTAAATPVRVTQGANAVGMVTAVASGVADAVLTTNPEPSSRIQFSPGSAVLGKGLRSDITLRRVRHSGQSYFDRDPLTLTLTSADPAKLSVPQQVTIAGGAASVSVPFSALDITTPIEVIATAAEYSSPAVIQVTIVEPSINFGDLDGNRGVGAIRDMFTVSLNVPGGTGSQVAMTDTPIALAVAEPNPAGVVSGLFDSSGAPLTRLIVRAGRNYASLSDGNLDYAYVGTPDVAGTYKISAQIAGQVQRLSALQQVIEGTLELELSEGADSAVVAKGMADNGVYIMRTRSGVPFSAVDPLTLTLTLSEPGKIEVPQTLVIAAGETHVEIPVAGLELTTTPVAISVSAPGYAAPSGTLEYTVVQAELDFSCELSWLFERHELCLRWSGNSLIDRPVSVVAVEQNPPGIVTGLYAGRDGLELLGPLELQGGSNSVAPGDICYDTGKGEFHCPVGFVGTAPGVTGSYRLAVSVPGMGEWLSDVITVSVGAPPPSPGLSFSAQEYFVGLGLIGSGVEIQRTESLTNPITVELVSSDPDKLSVPASVTLDAGSEAFAVPFAGLELTSSPVTISARISGQTEIFDSIEVHVVAPEIHIDGLSQSRGSDGERDFIYVRWVIPPISDYTWESDFSQVAQQTSTITLSVVDASPAQIVAGLYAAASGAAESYTLQIPAGQSASWDGNGQEQGLYVGSPSSIGSYRVHTQISGVGDWSSGVVTVSTPELRISGAPLVVGRGLRSSVVLARLPDAPANDLAITTSCTAASVCSVPASTLMPAGTSSVTVPITGGDLGATRLTAAAAGPLFTEVEVRVVKPTLELTGLPQNLVAGQSIPFQVSLLVPGSGDPYQNADVPVSVTLTSSAPGVASVTSNVVIPADANVSGDAIVLPIASGFTTITASAPGVDPVSSDPIPVSE